MRIARVIHESSPFAVIALERDGALYDIGELDRRFVTKRSPDLLAGATEFFSRVVALGGVGLGELDRRLLAGERPTEARIPAGSFVWLPACDPDRSLYVQAAWDPERPSFRLAGGRSLLGHEAAIPFPSGETRPEAELGIAALLGEDLRFASAAEAERAILGHAIVNDWVARDEEESHGLSPLSRDFATQLGPTLGLGELDGAGKLRAQVRIDGQIAADVTLDDAPGKLAETIAFVSQHLELHAGDVVGMRCEVPIPAGAVDYGAKVELLVERLGKLTGCPVRGPAPESWRRS